MLTNEMQPNILGVRLFVVLKSEKKLEKISIGLFDSKTREGNLFMRCVATRTASPNKFLEPCFEITVLEQYLVNDHFFFLPHRFVVECLCMKTHE